MRYRVRNADGEVKFTNFLELEDAWLRGLVEPSDEVQKEGEANWTRAGDIPLLVKAQRAQQDTPAGDLTVQALAAVAFGGVALACFFNGRWQLGLGLVLMMSALASRLTYKTFRKRSPNPRWPTQR